MTVLVVAEAVAILLLGLLVAGLLASHADILRKLHELGASVGDGHDAAGAGDRTQAAADLDFSATVAPRAVSTPAHDVAGETPAGDAIGIGTTGVAHHTLLAFLSSGCLVCSVFWEAFSSGKAAEMAGTRLVIVTKDRSEESPSRIAKLAPRQHPVVMSSGAWSDYMVPGSPYFVLVDGSSGRVVGEGSAGSWDKLRDLMGEALDDGKSPRSVKRARALAAGEAQVDSELQAAGIHPGHQSLFEDPEHGDEA
ncbi:MAG TPA: hypothetical protein VGC11_06135 [Acidimicrobiia bacterium]